MRHQPNTELASFSGLPAVNGIAVDEYGRTDDSAIVACGDCANGYHDFYSARHRLESVQNANDQAVTVAKTICGVPRPYSALPWFWSDQYDVKLQIAGLFSGHDEIVVCGDPNSGRKLQTRGMQSFSMTRPFTWQKQGAYSSHS